MSYSKLIVIQDKCLILGSAHLKFDTIAIKATIVTGISKLSISSKYSTVIVLE